MAVSNSYPAEALVSADEFKLALCNAIHAAGLPLLMGWPLDALLIVRTPGAGWTGSFAPVDKPLEIKLELQGGGMQDVV